MSTKAITKTTSVLILVIIVLLAAVVYYATLPRPPGPATITGTVTDAATGAAIEGATVELDGSTTITASDGTYSFSAKVGDYTLTVNMAGYESVSEPVSASEEREYAVDVSLAHRYKMALMLGGDETDVGFSYVAIQGAYRIRDEYGWEIDISRLIPFPDQARVLTDYAERGYDLVVCVGGQFISTVYFEGIVTQYNDTYFAQIPGLEYPLPPPNVVGLHPAFQTVGHYLAGVLAGKMTETNAVASIFGEWYPYLSMEFYAFKTGVESVNPDAKVYARVAGTWGDASIGYQIASALIEAKNVDIIVQVADLTGRGIIAACQDYGIMVIGTVGDQAVLAPEVTLTSIGMDTPMFMEIVVQAILDGTFDEELGGTSADINIGGFLYPFHQFEEEVPQSVKDLLGQTADDIENGAIVVPRTVTEEPPADPD